MSKTACRAPRRILQIIRATDPQWVSSLDFGNFPPKTLYGDIATPLPRIGVTHVKTKDADAQGKLTSYDVGRVFAKLKRAYYG